jgi:hypothetical protein
LKTWTIPRVPLSANRLLRAHWGKRRRDRDSWREHVRSSCGVPPREPPAQACLEVVVHRLRLQDPDNASASVKHLLDALVRAGWLRDDSREHLDLKVSELKAPARRLERTQVLWMPLSSHPPLPPEGVYRRVRSLATRPADGPSGKRGGRGRKRRARKRRPRREGRLRCRKARRHRKVRRRGRRSRRSTQTRR